MAIFSTCLLTSMGTRCQTTKTFTVQYANRNCNLNEPEVPTAPSNAAVLKVKQELLKMKYGVATCQIPSTACILFER
jgi:hypothetical protein